MNYTSPVHSREICLQKIDKVGFLVEIDDRDYDGQPSRFQNVAEEMEVQCFDP